MAKEPRENRVHIMFSDDELTEIDDWGFSHRIRTRAETIRRLCQIGIFCSNIFKSIPNELNALSQIEKHKDMTRDEMHDIESETLFMVTNLLKETSIEIDKAIKGKGIKTANASHNDILDAHMNIISRLELLLNDNETDTKEE